MAELIYIAPFAVLAVNGIVVILAIAQAMNSEN